MEEWGKAFRVWMESKQTQMVSPRKGFANSDVHGPSGKQVSDVAGSGMGPPAAAL